MKLPTAVIIVKGLCFVVIGGLTPLASSLAQWANDGSWPSGVNWVIIVAGCCVGGASQLLSFLSQSFGDYKEEMKAMPK